MVGAAAEQLVIAGTPGTTVLGLELNRIPWKIEEAFSAATLATLFRSAFEGAPPAASRSADSEPSSAVERNASARAG